MNGPKLKNLDEVISSDPGLKKKTKKKEFLSIIYKEYKNSGLKRVLVVIKEEKPIVGGYYIPLKENYEALLGGLKNEGFIEEFDYHEIEIHYYDKRNQNNGQDNNLFYKENTNAFNIVVVSNFDELYKKFYLDWMQELCINTYIILSELKIVYDVDNRQLKIGSLASEYLGDLEHIVCKTMYYDNEGKLRKDKESIGWGEILEDIYGSGQWSTDKDFEKIENAIERINKKFRKLLKENYGEKVEGSPQLLTSRNKRIIKAV